MFSYEYNIMAGRYDCVDLSDVYQNIDTETEARTNLPDPRGIPPGEFIYDTKVVLLFYFYFLGENISPSLVFSFDLDWQ